MQGDCVSWAIPRSLCEQYFADDEIYLSVHIKNKVYFGLKRSDDHIYLRCVRGLCLEKWKMDLMQNDEGLREMPRKPSRVFVLWSYWCLISLSMFSCLLRQVMGRTWVLLVIALQTPASKLPHTLQPPPHPRQELNRQPAASDEDRTTMYRASTPTGAELTPPTPTPMQYSSSGI